MNGPSNGYSVTSDDQGRPGISHQHTTGAREDDSPKQQGWKDLLRTNRLGIREDLENDIETFYHAHNLEDHVDLLTLKRGARLAHNRRMFMARGDFSAAEARALEREENPQFLKQPKELQVILMTCCIGAIVQGWSQANITGANLRWPHEFELNVNITRDSNSFNTNGSNTLDVWRFAAVNGVTYFAAGLIGAWLSDPLNEYFTGRRGALFVSGLLSFAASIGSAFTQHWETLLLCRLLQGVGMGAKASVVPIFESEVSPSRIRGRMLVSWQTFTAFGIFLGGAANLIFHDSWRLQMATGFIPCVPLLCLVFVCSESPRWLIKRSRYADAFKSLCRLRETHLQAARELYTIHTQIQVETLLISNTADLEEAFQEWSVVSDHTKYQDAVKKTNFFARTVQLFTISRNRRASLAAGVAMASQQLSGFNIFAFLSATFLSARKTAEGKSKYSDLDCLWYSFGFAAANTLFSPIAFWYIDTKGRRFLLLWSLVAIIPVLLATGFSFKIPNEDGEDAAVGLFIVVLAAAYSPGAGVVPFLYSSEVFPLVNREVGMSLSCGINFILAGVVATCTLPLINAFGPANLLGLFAGLDAIGAILVWLFLPGTNEATSLEEMNYVFGVPTRKHVGYQLFTVLRWFVQEYLPWMVKYYSPRRSPHVHIDTNPPKLDPLYIWERDRQRRREIEQEEQRELEMQRLDSIPEDREEGGTFTQRGP